ncbi:hypothetical protein BC830DRAFT_1086276 [Chytriomyces sp. MP71]|nr:hypothetical protein BC830DRAFT_1086276 [Chytriomyces sp. MP71]
MLSVFSAVFHSLLRSAVACASILARLGLHHTDADAIEPRISTASNLSSLCQRIQTALCDQRSTPRSDWHQSQSVGTQFPIDDALLVRLQHRVSLDTLGLLPFDLALYFTFFDTYMETLLDAVPGFEPSFTLQDKVFEPRWTVPTCIDMNTGCHDQVAVQWVRTGDDDALRLVMELGTFGIDDDQMALCIDMTPFLAIEGEGEEEEESARSFGCVLYGPMGSGAMPGLYQTSSSFIKWIKRFSNDEWTESLLCGREILILNNDAT